VNSARLSGRNGVLNTTGNKAAIRRNLGMDRIAAQLSACLLLVAHIHVHLVKLSTSSFRLLSGYRSSVIRMSEYFRDAGICF
jgi:hypothetical protein